MLASPHRTAKLLAAGLAAALIAVTAAGERSAVRAQDTLRAVAVVNDEVISMLDLFQRAKLAVLAAGIEPSEEERIRVERQVLRQLIDERLKLQEAERLGIEVSEAEVDEAIEQIGRRNGMSGKEFMDLLARNQILPTIMEEQVRAALAWRKIVQIRLLPSVVVGDEEVDEVIARIQNSRGSTEVRLFEIYLEVDDMRQDEEVKRIGMRLMDQLREGVSFAGLAGQFSQSAAAAQGGDLGWIRESELPEELADTVRQMEPGRVVGPIRGLTGYHILYLQDRRTLTGDEGKVHLKQVLLPGGKDGVDVEALSTKAAALREEIQSCEDVEQVAAEAGAPGSGDLGVLKVGDLSANLRRVVDSLPLEQASAPVEVPGGVAILVVCDRQGSAVDRQKIRESLVTERLEVLARRYMRDLRRQANVDLRL